MEDVILIQHWWLLDSDGQSVGGKGFNDGELRSVWLPGKFMFACFLIISFKVVSFVPSPNEIFIGEHVGIKLKD